MVTGHLAVAYAARARWQRASLVALLVATALPDLADFVLPQGDRCRAACVMYTHAFPAVLVLAAAMAALSWGIWHRRITALLAGALVVVHVLCDFFTGFKPFWAGGQPTGLDLYRFAYADFGVECALMTAGWLLLRRSPNAPRWAVHPLTLVMLWVLQGIFDFWLRTRG